MYIIIEEKERSNTMAYFLDNNNPDIIVVLERKSKINSDISLRVVWSKVENKFIYGTEEDYRVYIGEEEIPKFDTSEKIQQINRNSYKTGVIMGESSLYDDGTKLYEVVDTAKEHKLIFDASKITI